MAKILLFDDKTSRHYFERYQQGGLPALLDDSYSGAEPKLDEHQMSGLETYLAEHIFPDAKSVVAHIRRILTRLSGTEVFQEKKMNNRYYGTFAEFKRACESFFRKRKKYLPGLQTLLTENFHIQAA